eukprot:UN25457
MYEFTETQTQSGNGDQCPIVPSEDCVPGQNLCPDNLGGECIRATKFVQTKDNCELSNNDLTFVNGGKNGHCFSTLDISPLNLPSLTNDVRITIQTGTELIQNVVWFTADYSWTNTSKNFKMSVWGSDGEYGYGSGWGGESVD